NDCRDPTQEQDPIDAQLTSRGQERARDHQGFAGCRQAEALQEHAQEHGRVAVIADVALRFADEAVEHRDLSVDQSSSAETMLTAPRSEWVASCRDARGTIGSRNTAPG